MRVRTIFALLALCGVAMAQSAVLTPKQVVEEYCKLDAAGALTSSEGWTTINHLFVWPDAPGWDTFTVARGYKVGAMKKVGNTATVPVEYEVLGILDSTPRFRARPKKVTVVFHVGFTNKHWVMDADGNPDHEAPGKVRAWKITKPQNEPHVSLEKALAMAKEWLANAPDEETKKKAENAIAALETAR